MMTFRTTAVAALALTLLGGAAAAAPAGKLVLYTSQPPADAQQTVDAFMAKSPDVQVEWTRDGTTRIMSKLQAEFAAGAPQPDLLLIADAVTMEGLKADGRLMAYDDAPVAGYPESYYDADKTYFGTKLITSGIAYNTKADKPTSWTDLTEAAAKNQVVMPSPLYSGAAAIMMGTLTDQPSLGWDFYEGLAKNGTTSVQGNGAVMKAVAGGEKLYGVLVDFMALNAKRAGSPIDFVFPKEGVPAVTEPVAILSTARNPEAAKAFVAFLLSPEGQAFTARQGYLPALPSVEPPAGFPPVSEIKVLATDNAKVLRNDQPNKQRFADLFGG